jgi:hypothetical protein
LPGIDQLQKGQIQIQDEQDFEGLSQAKVQLWNQSQQDVWQDSVIADQGRTVYVTDQSQDCETGKVVQKYIK